MTIRVGAWRYPIFTVSSRRMWEPGFFAERIPWLGPVLRSLNFGWLFSALGMQPIENELHVRPFVSVAFALSARHPGLAASEAFTQSALERLPRSVERVDDLLRPSHFLVSRSRVKLTEVREPFRKEIMDLTREQVDADLTHFETLQRGGASIFLTPEGHYSGDGKMQRLRGALSRLAPHAEIWLAGISYDPFVGRRLSMLYVVTRAAADVPLDAQLKRVRPVTTSALLGSWLHEHGPTSFTPLDARAALQRALAELPSRAFVDPELERMPKRMLARALEGLERLGIVRRDGDSLRLCERRVHPQFPRTTDIVEYCYNFHGETLQGLQTWTPS